MSKRKRPLGDAGYIAERVNPFVPGTKVVIYEAEKSDIDTGGLRYAVLCEAHLSSVGDRSMPGARALMKQPENFCDGCQAIECVLGDVLKAVSSSLGKTGEIFAVRRIANRAMRLCKLIELNSPAVLIKNEIKLLRAVCEAVGLGPASQKENRS